MMSDLNETQRMIAETHKGYLVIDAGPGTGKTTTIVQRYVRMVESGINPKDILMVTFTRNAANEMESRLKAKLTDCGMEDKSMNVQVKTFDAFCLSVVMESPEDAGKLFGIEEGLTHSVRLSANHTANVKHFDNFLTSFLYEKGKDYGDSSIIAESYSDDFYDLISDLMSRGIYPLSGGRWFGGRDGSDLIGDTGKLLERMRTIERPKNDEQNEYNWEPVGKTFTEEELKTAATDDRKELIALVHDVYYEYIRKSIMTDTVTFGTCAILAFSILYMNKSVRERNRFKYMMIDEFQDTNASQLMLCLMLLSEPNMCVVGDWRQGIYGFRHVSIDNILHFYDRLVLLKAQLNDDGIRVDIPISTPQSIVLGENYRSSQMVIDEAFRCLALPATDKDKVPNMDIGHLTAMRAGEIGVHTGIRYVHAGSKDDEIVSVGMAVKDYMAGDYTIHDKGGTRPAKLSDIAILCPNNHQCRCVVDHLNSCKIPAFLDGDVEIMNTREGKLALAWLRYVNNSGDLRGIIAIMADLGYSLIECQKVRKDLSKVPTEIVQQRDALYSSRRRITEILTNIFEWYGINNDISQTIVNILSQSHKESLLAISDIISLMEQDMEKKTTYNVEADIESDSVTVMTLHGSKGLEFPIVIVPFIDHGSLPNYSGSSSNYRFDEVMGIRSMTTVHDFGGYSKVVKSMESTMAVSSKEKDYSESRRLLFVATSRAKQYVTFICGAKPSRFMKELSDKHDVIPAHPDRIYSGGTLIEMPAISGYEHKKMTMAVHDIMSFDENSEISDEAGGKGKDYGKKVHKEAELMFYGHPPSGKYPESDFIQNSVLSRMKSDGFIMGYSEMECALPVNDVTLRGIIDLILLFDDRIEIHDYKTDVEKRFQQEYELQLSIYANAAKAFYGDKKVVCFIDYVSQGESVEVPIMGMDALSKKVEERTRLTL